jgi:hypothetical protein
MKECAKCLLTKPFGEFYRAAKRKDGLQAYCKECEKARARDSRARNYTPEQKRRWHVKTRYGMTPAEVEAMREKQGHACALCRSPFESVREHIDHCHNTGAVRGILCMACNLKIGGWDDMNWRARALAYLGIQTK